jgi:hypothetical protein
MRTEIGWGNMAWDGVTINNAANGIYPLFNLTKKYNIRPLVLLVRILSHVFFFLSFDFFFFFFFFLFFFIYLF